jgi:hypothetical protein
MSGCLLQQHSKIAYQTNAGEDTWQSKSPDETIGTFPKILANRSGSKNPSTFAKTLKPLSAQQFSSISKVLVENERVS